jgi:SAM-dependent methyltransferase
MWRGLMPHLMQYIPPNARMLELGAGYCYFINQVSGRRRVAVDAAEIVIRHAAAGVEAFCEDAVQFLERCPDASFDFVFASNFLEHFDWPTLELMLPRIVRVMAGGGRLALIQPNFRLNPYRYFDDYTHRTIFTDVSLVDWLESAHLRVIKVVPRFLPLTVKSRLGGLGFLVPLYLHLPWRPLAGQMFVLAERPRETSGGQ